MNQEKLKHISNKHWYSSEPPFGSCTMNQEKLAKLNVVGDDEGAKRRRDIGGFPSKDYLCQKCGKGFGSMKAVHGHMKVHSKRPKLLLPQESRPVPKKRSTMGLKIAALFGPSSAGPSFSTWNKSEPVVSEFDEVEEAAACLMMLSRGARSRYNGEKKTVAVNGDGKRTESEVVFVERFIRAADQFKKVNVKMGWQFSESGLQKVEVCMHLGDDNKALGGQKRMHCPGFMNSKVKKECVNANPLKLGSTEDIIAFANSTGGKYKVHKCSVCFKVFASGQALGGHMRIHYTV